MQNKTQYAYLTLLSSYLATWIILLISTFAAAPENANISTSSYWLTGITVWLVKIIPLLIFIPGLYRKSERTSAWLAYVSMLYFIFAVLLIYTPHAFYYGWAMSISSMLLFLSCMFYTRWYKAQQNNRTGTNNEKNKI